MSGFGGMFSFGHAAYFGIGAYTSVWLLVEHGVSPWIGMARRGGVAAALFGVLIGFLALRYKLKGAYFALSTFAFAEMLRLLATNSDFVNRAVGLQRAADPGLVAGVSSVRARLAALLLGRAGPRRGLRSR